MNIVFLGDVRSIHVQKFIAFFAKEHEVSLVSFAYKGDPTSETGVRYLERRGCFVHLLEDRKYLQAIRFVRNSVDGADIVHCHFLTNYGFLGACSGFHPLTMSAMGDDILIHPKQMLYGLLVRYALSKADAVTCDGANSILALKELGAPSERIHLIYPGVNMKLFHPSASTNPPFPIVICPRGFEDVYDPKTLIKTIKLVNQKLPEVGFDILRYSKEAYAKYGDALKELSNSRVFSQLGNKELPSLFASATVSLNTSISDGGIPTSTIEAMACGTPVVSTDSGDASLWIDDGVNGYVCPVGDSEALADRIIKIVMERDPLMREMARARVEWCWDYQGEMEKAERLFKDLLKV